MLGSGLDFGLKSISTTARKLVYKRELSSAESGLQYGLQGDYLCLLLVPPFKSVLDIYTYLSLLYKKNNNDNHSHFIYSYLLFYFKRHKT